MISLRPYQLDMVQRTREAFRTHRRVIACASTGSGKTRMAAYIAKGAQDKQKRTLVLTHRKEIKEQLYRAFREAGVNASWTDAAGDRCVISTIGVAARTEIIGHAPDFIVVDECHHAVSGQFDSVLSRYPNAHILGLTATPQRLDGRGLNEHFDAIVLGPPMKQLIADGWLKNPVYYAPKELVDVSGLRRTAGDYNGADLEALMAKPSVTGNAVKEYQRLCAGRKAMAFCVTVAHAEAVAAAFCEAGIPAVSVDGKLSAEERVRRIQSFSKGRTTVLTSCELLGEGFDAPACAAAILLRPTQSLTLHLQQCGRPLRPDPAFSDCIILDHAGNCFRHGLAEDPREWTLEGRPRRQAQEPAIEVHRCEKCYAVFQGTECPQCGEGRKPSPRELKQKEGELERITEIQQKADKKASELALRTYDDFVAHGKRFGYAANWPGYAWSKSWQRKWAQKQKQAA